MHPVVLGIALGGAVIRPDCAIITLEEFMAEVESGAVLAVPMKYINRDLH